MANQNDSFIDEVTDDLRRDRLFLALRRFGWIVALVILAIVAAAIWREWSTARDARAGQAFGDALLAAEAATDPAARAAALEKVDASTPARAALRDLLAGGALTDAGRSADAAARFQAAAQAATAAGDRVTADLATLRAVMAQGPDMDVAERDAALTRLSAPGASFELLALELKALALVHAGRDQDAITLVRQIQQKEGLSQAQRRRLSEVLITLGVDPEPAEGGETAADPTRAAEVVPATTP